MPFADPTVCPSCAGRIEKATRCPHCGLDLTTHEIQQAWSALTVADQWVERARALQHTAAPAAAGQAAPAEAGAASLPTAPPIQTPPPRRRSLSAGAILLGLGALCILVAGTIFVTVSWGSLGVGGRAAVLLAVTGLFGALGWFVARRGLRGSSEAVWSVFLGLVTLDWFAARDQGLFGLDSWPFNASATTWAVLVIGAGVAIVLHGRRHLSVELLAPSIVGGVAAWVAGGSLGSELSDHVRGAFWPGMLAAVVAAAAAEVMRRGSMRVGSWIGLAGAGVYVLFAGVAAVDDAVEHPSLHDLTVDAHGLALLLLVLAAIGVGVVVSRGRWLASAVAVAGAATLVVLPIEDAWHDRGGYVSVAVLAAVGAWVVAQTGDWWRGARVTMSLGAVGLAIASAPWAARALAVAAEGGVGPRTDGLSTRLHPDDLPDAGPWWLVLVVGVALVSVLAAARRWPESTNIRPHLAPAAWIVGAAWGVAASATTLPPAVSIGSAILGAGAILAVALRKAHVAWTWVGPVLVAVAPLTTVSSWPAAVIVWPLAGVVLAAVAIRAADVPLRAAAAFMSTAWGLGTTAVVFELLDADDRWTGLGLVAAALVGLAIGVFAVRDVWGHRAVEVAAAFLGTVGLGLGSDSTLGFAALVWTVAGAGVVILGLVSTRRRWYRWAGSGLLGVGYVLRLAASDVDVVEAYTLPFAAFMLAAGLWAMRRSDGPGSVQALLPGVVLAMLPSLPQALDDPTSLRALLLGIGSAIALGVGVVKRWKVPFVAGALVLVILAVANLGPIALAVPRWILFALAGVLLGGAGITWEDRVRDGRAAVRYIDSMR